MLEIKSITLLDREDYIRMARAFYSTDAVLFRLPKEHFERGFDELMRSDEYMICHMFVLDGQCAGYGLISKTYSQEAGGMVWWIEELYVDPAFRGQGIGSHYLRYLLDTRPSEVKRFRLEVERENEGAVALYERMGFEFLAYDQMYRGF